MGGSAAGGTLLTITGTNFLEGAQVSVGGATAANVQVQSSTTLFVTTAARTAGLADVVVRNADGLTATLAQSFTYKDALPVFTDDPLRPGVTPVRAVHLQELRARIDELRSVRGLEPFKWTDEPIEPGAMPVKTAHVIELRTALTAVYTAAARPLPPAFADGASTGFAITTAEVTSLRAALLAIW